MNKDTKYFSEIKLYYSMLHLTILKSQSVALDYIEITSSANTNELVSMKVEN